MGIKSFLSKPLATYIKQQTYKDHENGLAIQQKMLLSFISLAKHTVFGRDHAFESIKNYNDYKLAVSVRDYEKFSSYILKIKEGNSDILWPGKPLYLSKTSGTTSGVKYIPITRESIPNHITTARNSLLMYIAQTGKAVFVDGKMIFLSGSPVLEKIGGIPTGRLSGIVNHHIPRYLKGNQLPTYSTNCIDDWETKVDAIVNETLNENMTLISGIPPWVQMYFDKLVLKKGVAVKDIFPGFSLFVYGGVNYEPYRKKIENTIGKKIDSVELFPASEGFIAFQDLPDGEGLLLNINSGIYYEFVEASSYFKPDAVRLSLAEVSLNTNYALLLTTNAGLWSYSIGDTVRFVSLKPYRLIVTGRIKHFISAFGEHVIGTEVEKALLAAVAQQPAEVIEFTVAPQVNPVSGLPYHEWFIEFGRRPDNPILFAKCIDDTLQQLNIYYRDLITGNILQPLKISVVRPNGFIDYMKSLGKLGGQNKVPRLANDRELAKSLEKFLL